MCFDVLLPSAPILIPTVVIDQMNDAMDDRGPNKDEKVVSFFLRDDQYGTSRSNFFNEKEKAKRR